MKRREFMKSVGVMGMFSLLGTVSFHGASGTATAGLDPAGGTTGRDSAGPDFRGPFDLAFDTSGNLYVTDPSAYRVARLDASNRVVSTFGGPGSRPGLFNYPKGIAVDAQGGVYVVDSNNCRVQVLDQAGRVTRILGSVGSIGGSLATPQGVFLDAKGRVFVTDTRNHRVQIFEGDTVVGIIGDLGDGPDQFRLPTACVVAPGGEILVLDGKHGAVKVFGPDLKLLRAFGAVGKAPGQMNLPQGMGMDSAGTLWIADTGNHRVQQLSLDGKVIAVVGKEGSGDKEFKNPTGVACRNGMIYVADNGNRRVQILGKA